MTQPIDIPRFRVLMATDANPEGEETEVTVRPTDQMRAEGQARMMGLGPAKESPITLAGLWVWAAMTRTQAFSGKFNEWRDACLGWDEVKPEPAEEDVAPEGPTE